MVHGGFAGTANQARADNWQAWALTVTTLVPVPALPKRLVTAFCWDGISEFGTSHDDFGMWRKLGFNVIRERAFPKHQNTPPSKNTHCICMAYCSYSEGCVWKRS